MFSYNTNALILMINESRNSVYINKSHSDNISLCSLFSCMNKSEIKKFRFRFCFIKFC